MAGFLNWWDSAELWLSGRGFVLQTIIVMPLMLALAYGLTATIDALLEAGSRSVQALRGPGTPDGPPQ